MGPAQRDAVYLAMAQEAFARRDYKTGARQPQTVCFTHMQCMYAVHTRACVWRLGPHTHVRARPLRTPCPPAPRPPTGPAAASRWARVVGGRPSFEEVALQLVEAGDPGALALFLSTKLQVR